MQWFSVAFLWFIVLMLLIQNRRTVRNVIRRRRNRNKSESERMKMNELVQKFIGRQCDIYVAGELGVSAKILTVNGNWIEIEKKNGSTEVLNLDYISRISCKNKDK